eukprot:14526382-Alexandrium_andersonii.AAC.1
MMRARAFEALPGELPASVHVLTHGGEGWQDREACLHLLRDLNLATCSMHHQDQSHWYLNHCALMHVHALLRVSSPQFVFQPRPGVEPEEMTLFELAVVLFDDGWQAQ